MHVCMCLCVCMYGMHVCLYVFVCLFEGRLARKGAAGLGGGGGLCVGIVTFMYFNDMWV